MRKKEKRKVIPTENRIKQSAFTTVICDVILIAGLVVCLLTYISRNNVNTYNQNIENITNIATAESELMRAAFDNSSYEVVSAYNYCNGKTVTEILDYLSIINSTESEYQLLKRDEVNSTNLYHIYTGYSTVKVKGAYSEVAYENTSLAESIYSYGAEENGVISYSQNFTNRTDGMRYFAVFCGISVQENGEMQRYYLIKPQKENKVLAQLRMYSQYADLAMAVCYADGKYLACDNSFRADNFYEYLYRYNDLSLDEKNAIRDSVINDEDGSGVLTYLDFKGRNSVFAYASCGDSDNWHIIVSVPVSEFVSNKLLSFFPLIIIIFLVILLVFNIWRLLVIVNQLRFSVERERIANASKSSFLSRMSHEIRTPLNAVIGYNTIARTEMNEAKNDAERRQAEMKVMDCLDKSGVASKHLLTIINDVLDMSAIESGKIQVVHEQFDFKGLITSLTTVFYSQAKSKRVQFEVLFGTLTEEWFVGDQMRTNQILTNLLSNAIKFTPEGGKVTLKITQPEAMTNAMHIHFEVSDTGIGMTPEYLTRIWAPFEQADSSISRRFGGTGLGLSITKNLVDLMGGNISVASTPGVGTTFQVDLTFEKSNQSVMSTTYDFSSINALVADDDASTCDYIRLLFNRCGARCCTVLSGTDALKAVSVAMENHDPFSICLIDWRMPHMDGIETIKEIRKIVGKETPIIVLTAYDYSEIAEKATEIGATRFLSKPLFQSSLFDLLTNISKMQPEKPLQKVEKIDFSGKRVLLTEDNEMNMEIAKKILSTAGFTVDSAWNGREALDLFTASATDYYDAILMDVHMPEMNGHEATRAIRASLHPQANSIPIIAMTADAFAENVAEAYAVGMNDHISKPIDTVTLFDTLRKHIQK